MARVVLVGYGQMLYSLIKGIENSHHEILGVMRLDRVRYSAFELFFKDIFNPSKDYTIIKSGGLYDIRANSVNSPKFLEEIRRLKPDLILVGSWGEKFKRKILEEIRVVNFHPSLLPKNRGANPYFWAIYLGQKLTGLTAHFMDEGLDTGDIIAQYEIPIEDEETGTSLKNKACFLAEENVKIILDLFDKKLLCPVKQREDKATYQAQITKEDTVLDLRRPGTDIQRHIRALTPWAVPRVRLGREVILLQKFEFLESEEYLRPYKVLENNKKYLVVAGADFLLKIYK